MSRFRKLTHVVWHCQYHIVWVPKYRYRILKDRVGVAADKALILRVKVPSHQLLDSDA